VKEKSPLPLLDDGKMRVSLENVSWRERREWEWQAGDRIGLMLAFLSALGVIDLPMKDCLDGFDRIS